MNEQHNPWTVIDEQKVYDNKWIAVTHYNVINPSGGKGVYGKIHFKSVAIGIVAVDDNMNTYLVGQYRFTINQYSWEIPEGGCPFNEDPLNAAKRELLEETGLKANHWQLLGESFLSNSVSDEKAIYYLATGLSQHEAEPEETEQLQTKKIPLQEAFAMVDNGIITDALAVLALQKTQLLLLQGQLHFNK
ncbi:MAG: DNA mismatch repair protein MutT [Chitinophaga sp.]|jgi:8-oxo-dGTP pyrophosphatase MutT (NUDIX family)|nr:DNA mismatch repair protein MutT [Chitinophaga sp.]